MKFPTEYSNCYVMENDDIDDILTQLAEGNTFKCKITQPFNGIKEVCSFKARVNNPYSLPSSAKVNDSSVSYYTTKEAIEYYWMTNDDRRSLVKKLLDIKSKR